MNADSCFLIGKMHEVCEDYVICSQTGNGRLVTVLSDGCSSSRFSDIGARILVHSALYFLLRESDSFITDYNKMGEAIITQCYRSIAGLALPESCLDATLLFAIDLGNEVYVACYGDGIIMASGSFGTFFHQVTFNQSMPYYLSYWFNEEGKKRYKENQEMDSQQRFFSHFESNGTFEKVAYDDPFFLYLPKESWVGISSDGMSSFRSIHDGSSLTILEVLMEASLFKNHKGFFVKRRMKRLIKDYALRGCYNYDDISLGVLNFDATDETILDGILSRYSGAWTKLGSITPV